MYLKDGKELLQSKYLTGRESAQCLPKAIILANSFMGQQSM